MNSTLTGQVYVKNFGNSLILLEEINLVLRDISERKEGIKWIIIKNLGVYKFLDGSHGVWDKVK